MIRPEAARSVIDRDLPPAPPASPDECSLVLFYQYVEPPWTEKEHRTALKQVISTATEHGVMGRGRCAREGLNCTLTGTPQAVRAFCMGLRQWKPELFNQTDFKITDHVEKVQGFKALTIRRTDELVAYGMADEQAPVLQSSNARHVEADEYHALMQQKDTVIIDVRNAYESAIGHFAPPEGGATLIDPKMRNSHEFPKWLNAPQTQEQLHGKRVLMYCTGGIRCERASALMDAMARTSNGAFDPKDVVMVRGGVERYMKTFPEGGFWKGKNYLFDRRREQVPEAKTEEALAKDVESYCCVCRTPCAVYRGQYACAGKLPPPIDFCKVPVIVCRPCARSGTLDESQLFCPLCEEGFVMPQEWPDILTAKRQLATATGSEVPLGAAAAGGDAGGAGGAAGKRARREAKAAAAPPSTRLFVGSLPFVVSASELRALLQAAVDRAPGAKGGGGESAVTSIRWLSDHRTNLFYGSAFVEMRNVDAASAVVSLAQKEAAAAAAAARAPAGTQTAAPVAKGKSLIAKTKKLKARALAKAIADGSLVETLLTLGGRRLRVSFAPTREGDDWPPKAGEERERPPVGM